MLGDTGVAVHPEDERYRRLIGREVACCRWWTAAFPIVADDAVDPAFGTGAVKVTPAHDPNDFEIGRRHELPGIDVMTPEARMSLAGARARSRGSTASRRGRGSWPSSRRLGLLEKVEPHRHAVGHCYRCDTVVEPRLSDQWFVQMEPLAEPALAGVPRRHASASSPSAAATTTPTGWRTSATGASPGSSGGATASRSGTASDEAAAGRP